MKVSQYVVFKTTNMCFYVIYTFKVNLHCNCLNVLAWNKCNIWNFSKWNRMNKWLSIYLHTKQLKENCLMCGHHPSTQSLYQYGVCLPNLIIDIQQCAMMCVIPWCRKVYQSPLSFKTCTPTHLSWHPSQENTRFSDDTPGSGWLKKINIKPWKPITYRNCVS